MRRLWKVWLLAVGAAGFLLAQRGGGGHFGGGGAGGFHASAPSSAPHFSAPAARPYSGGGYSGYSTGNRAVVPPASYGGHLTFSTPGMPGTYGNSIRYGAIGGRPPLRPPIRRPGGYPYYGAGFYPYLGLGYGYYDSGYDPYYDSGSSAPYAYQDQYAPQPEPMMDPGAAYPPTAYPPVPYAPYPDQQQPLTQGVISEPEAPSVPITIILKSGQKFVVQNYAIVDGMFWDFTKPNAKRMPIASINVAASAKATEDAGGTFPEESFVANPR